MYMTDLDCQCSSGCGLFHSPVRSSNIIRVYNAYQVYDLRNNIRYLFKVPGYTPNDTRRR